MPQPLSTVPFPDAPRRPPAARVRPATRREMGFANAVVCGAMGRATGGPAPRVFTTLARHRRLFRGWLRFASRLMPFGTLPRADAELVILRVAVRCGSDYEWNQHVALGQRAGLSVAEIERAGADPVTAGWDGRRRALLAATDELLDRRALGDDTWARLRRELDEREAIELCLLVGHYAMLAGALNALGVEPEARAMAQLPGR